MCLHKQHIERQAVPSRSQLPEQMSSDPEQQIYDLNYWSKTFQLGNFDFQFELEIKSHD
jgi:hypothetical protein